MQGTESISVKLKHPIPVIAMYLTAVVLEYGEVHFFEDIYGLDTALEHELAETLDAAVTSGEPGPRPRE
jgi:murein L,D-transpeptidase YcbB/YkuD